MQKLLHTYRPSAAEARKLVQRMAMIVFERQMGVVGDGNPEKFGSPRRLFRHMLKCLCTSDPADHLLACQTIVLFGRALALSSQAATVGQMNLATRIKTYAAADRAGLQFMANALAHKRLEEARQMSNELGFNDEKTPLSLVGQGVGDSKKIRPNPPPLDRQHRS